MYETNPDYDGHALIVSRQSVKSRFKGFIAIHNDARGPAIGGCRITPYASTASALTDVLRLSKGMSYKTAIANIPYGGGKAVIIADPGCGDKATLLREMGDFVRSLEGRYITSFDTGTTVADVRVIGERTQFVAGTLEAAGNASQTTARGVYYCMRTAAGLKFGASNLSGLTVAIQGVGNVGGRLAQLLARDGAKVIIADKNPQTARLVAEQTGSTIAEDGTILGADADILSPCALGAILNPASIPTIRAKVIVGGANNQLATPEDDIRLKRRDILYCPDYVANAGGIIDLHYQRAGWSADAIERHILTLAETFREIANHAAERGIGTGVVADEIAQKRLMLC